MSLRAAKPFGLLLALVAWLASPAPAATLEQVVPAPYKRHAHHWLILHGRYTCLARRPLCERCIIADLCKWPGKTVA